MKIETHRFSCISINVLNSSLVNKFISFPFFNDNKIDEYEYKISDFFDASMIFYFKRIWKNGKRARRQRGN
jgi:hypothetical protein